MQKTALITGASSGIGKEFAKLFASDKHDVVLVARRIDKLNELKTELESEYGIRVITIEKDLSQRTAAQEIFDKLQKDNVQIDFLINNAGLGSVGFFDETDLSATQNIIDVNISTLTQLTSLFLPQFVARNSGRVLNVSSVGGNVPGPFQATYFASKAYVTKLSNAINFELKQKHSKVTVTNLMPGMTNTEFAKTAGYKTQSAKRFGKKSPSEAARAGYKAMLKGKANKYTCMGFGQRLGIALMPILPKCLVLKVIFKIQSK